MSIFSPEARDIEPPPCDLEAFIADCVRGDPSARAAFQERYGRLIYTFPVRIFHLAEEEAGNFYVYVFEKERVFKRIRTFEGRNAIQFKTYLSHYVLRDLLFEWWRSRPRTDTVSLDRPVDGCGCDGSDTTSLHDLVAAEGPTPESALEDLEDMRALEEVLRQMDAEKRLVLKLLALGTSELTPGDVRLIARTASRSIRETLALVERMITQLADKAVKAREKQQHLHVVSSRIQEYQRDMRTLDEKTQARQARSDAPRAREQAGDRRELARKLDWRYRQQARLREEFRRFDIRPSYKDMAKLLNLPLGTVCSRVARAREEIARRLAEAKPARALG